jgi:hypothetical protein
MNQRQRRKLLSISQAIVKYGISWRRLAEWRRNGLPCLIGPGRLVLVKESDIQTWLKVNSKGKDLKPFSRLSVAAENVDQYGCESLTRHKEL